MDTFREVTGATSSICPERQARNAREMCRPKTIDGCILDVHQYLGKMACDKMDGPPRQWPGSLIFSSYSLMAIIM